jgi:hypothetical protein
VLDLWTLSFGYSGFSIKIQSIFQINNPIAFISSKLGNFCVNASIKLIVVIKHCNFITTTTYHSSCMYMAKTLIVGTLMDIILVTLKVKNDKLNIIE